MQVTLLHACLPIVLIVSIIYLQLQGIMTEQVEDCRSRRCHAAKL